MNARLPFIMIVLVLSGLGLSRAVADASKDRFLSAYEPALEKQRHRFISNRRIRVVATRFLEDGSIEYKREHEFVANDSCVLGKTITRMDVERVGDKVVSRPVEDPIPWWSLLRPDGYYKIVQPKGSGPCLLTEIVRPVKWDEGCTKAPLAYFLVGFPIVTCLRQSNVTVRSLEECQWHGQQLTRLETQEAAPNRGILNRSYLFDPKEDWLLQGIEQQRAGSPIRLIERHYYRKGDDGSVIPSKTEARAEDEGKQSRIVYLIEYVSYERADPDPGEFLLTRFGLPEPGHSTMYSSSRYLWLFGAALLVAVVAFIVYRISRHRSGGVTNP